MVFALRRTWQSVPAHWEKYPLEEGSTSQTAVTTMKGCGVLECKSLFSADIFWFCGKVENFTDFFYSREIFISRVFSARAWELQVAGTCGDRRQTFLAPLSRAVSTAGLLSICHCRDIHTESWVNGNLILNTISLSFHLLSENKIHFAQGFLHGAIRLWCFSHEIAKLPYLWVQSKIYSVFS